MISWLSKHNYKILRIRIIQTLHNITEKPKCLLRPNQRNVQTPKNYSKIMVSFALRSNLILQSAIVINLIKWIPYKLLCQICTFYTILIGFTCLSFIPFIVMCDLLLL